MSTKQRHLENQQHDPDEVIYVTILRYRCEFTLLTSKLLYNYNKLSPDVDTPLLQTKVRSPAEEV